MEGSCQLDANYDYTLSPSSWTWIPSLNPTVEPTINPTIYPTVQPSIPTLNPTYNPTAIPTADPTSHCAYDIDGGGWTLVRHTYNKWFDASDSLVGTADYGNVTGPLSKNEFAIPFNASNGTQFLFSDTDCDEWLITTYDQFAYKWGAAYNAKIVKSCISNESYTAEWYNRDGNPEDPWISYQDHYDNNYETILYGESNNNYHTHVCSGQNLNGWLRNIYTTSTEILLYEEGPISGINNSIGVIDFYDIMMYELDIRIDDLPSLWGNIFWCGNENQIRMPVIAMKNESGVVNGFHIKYSTTDNWNDPDGVGSMGDIVIIGTTYHIQINVSQDWMTVQINGQNVHNASKSPHELLQNQTCGAPASWTTSKSYATISNITISTGKYMAFFLFLH